MNAPVDATTLSFTKFGIGQPVPRSEDPKLLRGEGRYTDDINLPDQLYCVMVRSGHAHGRILGIDTDAARAMPGVLGVFTGNDLVAAGFGIMSAGIIQKNQDGSPMAHPPQWPLTIDKVRYVGDPLAFVVATSPKAAKDGAESVVVDIEPLPAVTLASEAAQPDAPRVHDDLPDNILLHYHYGNAERVAAAFAAAAHITRLEIRNTRIAVCPMEPRSAIAEYDPAHDHYTFRVGCQGVFGLRGLLASVLKVPQSKVRVLTGNVGGSFGMKSSAFPEYFALLHAAKVLGRPVKWTDERSDSFLADSGGRDHEMITELALDETGKFLAVRVSGYGNCGAYLSNAATLPATINATKNIIGVYATEAVEIDTRCVFTHTTPVGPYRGAGRPEGNYYMERLIDTAAREMGIDRLELRRRNHIRPEAMPYDAPNACTYDSGEFASVLDKAISLADVNGFANRRAASEAAGKKRGLGIGQFLEVTAPPQKEMGGLRFEADGTVTIITGTLDYGQGHASPFAQVLVDRLGIPFDRIRLLQGDSDELIAGGGTGGSKSMMASGAAIVEASELVMQRGLAAAAFVLEAAQEDIEFGIGQHGGHFTVAGTDRSIGIMELAEILRSDKTLPPDVPRSLDVQHVFEAAPSAFPNGCHIAEVEVDPDTGVLTVVKYTMLNDFGVEINPLLVAGQAHGGIIQGIGQALLENTIYDSDGQVLTGSYMDYAMPRAGDAPSILGGSHSVPARTNPLGVKGCGEAGCAGSLPAVMNAIVDALSSYGIKHIDMPATPQRIWAAIQASKAG
jgi:carbon-monoxide dehydrogenase large subunit